MKNKMLQKRNTLDSAWTPKIWFSIPATIFYTIFLMLPMAVGILSSFTNWTGTTLDLGEIEFVGLLNYERMLKDANLHSTIGVTVTLSVICTIAVNAFALLFAVLLNGSRRFSTISRSILYIPGVLSGVAVAFLWRSILNYAGMINSSLEVFGLEQFFIRAFETRESGLISISIVYVWAAVGGLMMLYLAAITRISGDIKDASAVDGANPWQHFWHITMPMIRPQIGICIMLSIISTLQLYDLVLALTGGGPGTSTQTIMFYILEQGTGKWRTSYANAISVTLCLVIMIAHQISQRISKLKEG